MRVLIAAVTVAVAVAVAPASCYSPAIDNCQFACGANQACPDGTACEDGFCRVAGGGACATGSDGGVAIDGSAGGDTGVDAPACPTTSPCGATPVRVADDDCAALCTQELTFSQALAMCGSDNGSVAVWHIAILDSDAKRTAFPSKLPASVAWMGLERDVTTWRWLDVAQDVQPSTGAPWASGEPSATNTVGTFDATVSPAVFRTGTLSDQKQFLCEYRP